MSARGSGLVILAFISGGALAQASDPAAAPIALQPVTVTATRAAAAPFDIPASIDSVGVSGSQRSRTQVNLSEEIGAVPGLQARDRQNYAQDVQISIRGFGARSSFGIRGVRLYVDGIPATLPDGQGQISNVELGSTDRIEVLRGPFSALYGNASGGVVQVFTEDPSERPVFGFGVTAGSDGLVRLSAKASGSSGALGYVAAVSDFSTGGYRDHSAAERQLENVKLTLGLAAGTHLTLIGNSVTLPKAQDPLGLTRAQFEADPRSVDPSAVMFDTRKTVDQTQAGLILEHRIGAGQELRALLYDGHRNTQQFQAIPVATQASPLYPGGVIALGRDYHGADLRWTGKGRVAELPYTLVAGLADDRLREHRNGYQNFIGTTLGVQGALRRDETNDVSNFDQYAQGTLQLSPRWTLHAGIRHSRVRFESADAYIVGPNPDDSGGARYHATLPVAGLLFALNDQVHLYATAGRGFETPTLNELAYRPNGATGLNFGLQAATSDSGEVGVKVRDAAVGELNLALFRTRTAHEIATLSNVAGRATYQNVGSTRRTGLELGWARSFAGNARAVLAYTALDARYRDAFTTCSASPCATPTVAVPAGNRLPGVARTSGYAELAWAPALGWRAGIEGRTVGRVEVNDPNTDAAAGYAVLAIQTGYAIKAGPWRLDATARLDNALARRYAGSVIVNESNGRYFEPAPGRTWAAGLSARLEL